MWCCSKSTAIWGTPAVGLTHSGRQSVTHSSHCGKVDNSLTVHQVIKDSTAILANGHFHAQTTFGAARRCKRPILRTA
jgi:hypothetical protein